MSCESGRRAWCRRTVMGALLAAVILPGADAQAPVWVARYGATGRVDGDAFPGPGASSAVRGQRCLARDAAGNVYVAGQAWNGRDYDFLTVKYTAAGGVAWSALLDRGFDDVPFALAVDASGNVYVTGRSYNGANTDFLTAKYDVNGVRQWAAYYNGPTSAADEGMAVAVDAAGNVYVAGLSYGTNWDYRTIKYDAAGAQQWTATFNGGRNDWLYALALDAAGNAYVTGYSSNGANDDYATVKYDPAGTQLWARIYNSALNSTDQAYALAVDAAGNAHVTGRSWNGTNYDYLTIKYDAAGTQQWATPYNGPNNGTGLQGDEAQAVAVDGAGNVYVSGYSWNNPNGYDYVTVKYDAAGAQQWAASYNGPSNSTDQAYAVAVDGAGNVYATGHSWGGASGYDYATVQYDAAGTQQWATRHVGPPGSSDEAFAVVAGGGQVIVAGQVFDGVTFDWGIVTYDGSGTLVRAVAEPPTRGFDDMPGSGDFVTGKRALAVDAAGNAYVTGRRFNGTGYDAATVKYDTSGVQQWSAVYDGPAGDNDEAFAVAVDGAGNVYVAGRSRNGVNWDFLTIKYDAAGTQQWAQVHNEVFDDEAFALALDGAGRVLVTGRYWTGANYDVLTVQYDAAGVEQWHTTYAGPGSGPDQPTAIATDAAGNVYVAGSAWVAGQNYNYLTLKYDPAGVQQWVRFYNSPTGNNLDQAYALAVDGAGNAHVTGLSFGGSSNFNAVTVKYDPAGVQQWAAVYNSPAGREDQGNAVALDAAGNVYVAGEAFSGTNWDAATLKYNAAGVLQWARLYDGPGTTDERALALAVDGAGSVYAGGLTWNRLSHDYLTLKYDAAGALQWSAVYDGPAAGSDRSYALAVDAAGFAYVGGWSVDSDADFLTVKYAPVPDTTPPGNPTLTSTSHLPGQWSPLAPIAMQWSGAGDPGGSGVAGYSVLFDTSAATVPDAAVDVPHGADPHTLASPPRPDGTSHYFHLRTCDNAGNCAGAVHFGPAWIDATPPGAAGSLQSPSHTTGVPSSLQVVQITWSAAADNLSGIAGYSYFFDGSPASPCDEVLDVGPGTTVASSAPLADGSWYAHVCAADNAGNWGPVAHAGPYVIVTEADLEITKSDGLATAVPGEQVAYTILASNNGVIPVPGALVSDAFPGELTCTWTCAAGAGSVCLPGPQSGPIADTVTLAAGGSVTYTATCDIHPAATGTLTNEATVTPPAGIADPLPGNNSASDSDTLTPVADLSVPQSDSPDPAPVYGTITYTLNVTNAGPSSLGASGVTLTDTLPVGTTFAASNPPAPVCNAAAGTLTCDLPGLDAGASLPVTVTVTADAGTIGTVTNTAAVSSAVFDPDPANDASSEPTRVRFVKGDQNNDLGTDLFLRHAASGTTVLWSMSEVTRLAEAPLNPQPAPALELFGVDDFDGDWRNDLVLRDTLSGVVEFWLMNGIERLGPPVPLGGAPTLPLNWKLSATADFNHDGRPDLVWRNFASQKIVIWTLNGTVKTGNIIPFPDQAVDFNWEIAAARDYNGDGNTDFLWYNFSSGKIVLWFMDANVQRISGQFTSPPNAGDNNWKVLAGGDYGAEPGGLAEANDIVWRNADSGRFVVWHMDLAGNRTWGRFTVPAAPETDPTGWTIVGPR